jgi:hypothetical protein
MFLLLLSSQYDATASAARQRKLAVRQYQYCCAHARSNLRPYAVKVVVNDQIYLRQDQ